MLFEELAWADTPIGEISLRRRHDPALGHEVHEVKLGDEYLMSSAFTAAEIALADLGLARLAGDGLTVLVGGLGLGYTARAVLDDPRVASLTVVDALPEVIDWHRRGLVPLGEGIAADPRCRLTAADFFAEVMEEGETYDALLVDIDHSPSHHLAPGGEGFYTPRGTARMARRIREGGVFGLWSNDPPEEDYLDVLRAVFTDVEAHVVAFWNPLQGRDSTNTVYLGTR